MEPAHPARSHRVFISDLHSNVDNVETFFTCMEGFVLEQVYCAGDIIHHSDHHDANRVIDMLRTHGVKGIKGNHDRIRPGRPNKIREDNVRYLEALKENELVDGILFFHSSVREPGTHLLDDDLRTKEARHISEGLPHVTLAVYGHSHEAHILGYHKNKKSPIKSDPRGPVTLQADVLYLLNPGSLGERYADGHNLAVLENQTEALRIHSLDDLVRLHKARKLLLTFEEEWMSHLKGDQWSWVTFGKKAPLIASAYPEFPAVVSVVADLNFKGTERQKRGYFEHYSKDLAQALETIADPLVYTYYDVRHPLQVRENALS